MHLIRIYFDGGCKPNPGQGYGSYEILPERLKYHQKNMLIQFGFMTSNMAEYHSLISALKKLWHDSKNGAVLSLTESHPICTSRITLDIFSDSKLLVQQMNGRWKCKVAHIVELMDEAHLILKEFGHWKLTWNPREKNVARFGH